MKNYTHLFIMTSICLLITSCDPAPEIDQKFTVAVIPDTQNYVDFMPSL